VRERRSAASGSRMICCTSLCSSRDRSTCSRARTLTFLHPRAPSACCAHVARVRFCIHALAFTFLCSHFVLAFCAHADLCPRRGEERRDAGGAGRHGAERGGVQEEQIVEVLEVVHLKREKGSKGLGFRRDQRRPPSETGVHDRPRAMPRPHLRNERWGVGSAACSCTMRCIAARAAASERGDAETSVRLREGGRARVGQALRGGPTRPAWALGPSCHARGAQARRAPPPPVLTGHISSLPSY
jgi:hypothetical protein